MAHSKKCVVWWDLTLLMAWRMDWLSVQITTLVPVYCAMCWYSA
jgi:hypothetical protein